MGDGVQVDERRPVDIAESVRIACEIAARRRELQMDLRAAVESGDPNRIERAARALLGNEDAEGDHPAPCERGSTSRA